MKIENLKVGMVVKNYRHLCELLEIDYSTGNTKIKQVCELQRFVKYDMEGHKIIIEEIYETPLEKTRVHGGSRNIKIFSSCQIPKKHWKSIGIYSLTLNSDIYIGSTYASFRQRFLQHRDHGNTSLTLEMMQKGAIFSILEICENITEPELRIKENKWIEYFQKKPN